MLYNLRPKQLWWICCWITTTFLSTTAWIQPPPLSLPIHSRPYPNHHQHQCHHDRTITLWQSSLENNDMFMDETDTAATSISQPHPPTKRPFRQPRPIRRSTSRSSSSSTNSQTILNPKRLERQQQLQQAQERNVEALKDPTLFTTGTSGTNNTSNNTTNYFDTIQPAISSATKRAIHEVFVLPQMTDIQYQTYPIAVQGMSLLGRARTGTGKTIAYLLPAIERLLQLDYQTFRPGRTIGIIIIAPTRELVIQLSQEATKLLTFHHGYTVQPLYGGISIQRDRAILFHRPVPTVLVSTPGRLYDLLRDAATFRVHGNRNLVDVINECPIVIFDEADRLMEGFVTEINTISSYLPRIEKRQTMLFSATISSKLKHVLNSGYPKMLPMDYVTVDCVDENDVTTQTNQRVTQTFVQLSDMQLYVSGFLYIVESLMTNNDNNNGQSNTKKSKVIVFLPTAKLVKFFTDVLNYISSLSLSSAQPYDIYSIHSRMSQGSRNRASTQFRAANSNNCILLSSDVSARGVDYPDVTFVVQYGAPYNDELYVHRLGRTGRAGQEGNGLLVLLPFETRFISKCRKYNIRANIDQFNDINNPNADPRSLHQAIQSAVRGGHVVLAPSAESACTSFVAHYLEYSRDKNRSGSTGVLSAAMELATAMGLSSLPKLPDNIHTELKSKKES